VRPAGGFPFWRTIRCGARNGRRGTLGIAVTTGVSSAAQHGRSTAGMNEEKQAGAKRSVFIVGGGRIRTCGNRRAPSLSNACAAIQPRAQPAIRQCFRKLSAPGRAQTLFPFAESGFSQKRKPQSRAATAGRPPGHLVHFDEDEARRVAVPETCTV